MNIIIDAMGGDNAPTEIVKGAVLASQKSKSRLVLVGNRPKIESVLREQGADPRVFEIVHTEEEITMEDDPLSVVRSKKESSMAVGLRLLKEGGDAMVSAGNTGALHAGSSLIVRTFKGVQRSAIATVLPFTRPILLMDSGANVNVTADYLVQWAIMGTIYMKNVLGIEHPEVGLLNNGTEEHKGTQVQIDAYAKLAKTPGIRFHGNVEGKELPFGPCDVLVTDGFTGNITLKLIEGMSKYMFSLLKDMYMTNTLTKLSFFAMKDQLRQVKHDFDASEYGGAPLLGLQKPVIKAHGSSDARAISNAVRQAEAYISTGVSAEIADEMEALTEIPAE
ncbi:MAG: phosphate acyltransferase PlsX [Clostridiales bacterium]|nr:phosphate acyltransferase PlsX [Clostridia bacterium]MCR5682231.1 phosphate acyltransferase PlsX [Clostridiales bacterium]